MADYQLEFPVFQESDERTRKNIVLRVFLFALVSGPLFEFLRTLYVKFGISNTGAMNLLSIYVVATLALAAIAVVVIAWASREASANRIVFLYRLIIIAGCVDLLLIPLVYMGSCDVHQAYSLNVVATSCLSTFMLILYTCVCRGNQESSVRIVALLKAASDLGPLLGLLTGKWIVNHVEFSIEYVYLVTALLVIAWVVVCLFVLTDKTILSVLDVISSKGSGNFMKHCQLVSERFGLSERESEVLIMLAKGRNSAYIQEKLCLSKNTVSSHRKHIYTKLGVHSSQELIDLVQGDVK